MSRNLRYKRKDGKSTLHREPKKRFYSKHFNNFFGKQRKRYFGNRDNASTHFQGLQTFGVTPWRSFEKSRTYNMISSKTKPQKIIKLKKSTLKVLVIYQFPHLYNIRVSGYHSYTLIIQQCGNILTNMLNYLFTFA